MFDLGLNIPTHITITVLVVALGLTLLLVILVQCQLIYLAHRFKMLERVTLLSELRLHREIIDNDMSLNRRVTQHEDEGHQ
jgi:hypothetical protein